jgi:protein-L-isoaspartate(D-aspartate) O-methyltransferase
VEPLQAHRNFFAELITAMVGAPDSPLTAAFRSTPREQYLGPGPWRVFHGPGYTQTPTAHPALLYQDIVVALEPDRGINNGQPSLHARCLAALDVKEGETIVHIGVGGGYYTAILAALTSIPDSDVIYVSAGATAPFDRWLDALRPSGRLLFPLTPDGSGGRPGMGNMLLVTRVADESFNARFICPVMFIPCVGGRDEETGKKLAEAFQRGRADEVRSLRRNTPPDETCWCSGNGWWLSTAAS